MAFADVPPEVRLQGADVIVLSNCDEVADLKDFMICDCCGRDAELYLYNAAPSVLRFLEAPIGSRLFAEMICRR